MHRTPVNGLQDIVLTPDVLAEATRRIVDAFRPERVVLFGSRARGDHGPDSDIDLLVVTRFAPSVADLPAITERIGGGLPLQLVFMTPDQWAETHGVVCGIAYPAEREGRLLHAA